MNSEIITRGPFPSPVMYGAMQEVKAFIDALQTLTNDIRSTLKGDYVIGATGIDTGSTTANVSNLAVEYGINGIVYKLGADAVGTALSGDNIPQGTYGAWRLEVGADGTVDIIEAADNATGYASAVLAVAGLPVLSADHVSLGTVTASKSDGVFDPGTTGLDDGNTTEDFIDGTTMFAAIGAAVA